MKKLLMALCACLCVGGFSACDLKDVEIKSSDMASVEQSADKVDSVEDSSADKVDSVEDSSVDRLPSEGLEFVLDVYGRSYWVAGMGTCIDENLVIPSTYQDLSVTGIAKRALQGKSFKSVTIPASIKTMELEAFEACTSLKNIYYEGSVEDWCEISFANAWSNPLCNSADFYIDGELITELIIPDTVTVIKGHAFQNIDTMIRLEVSDSVTEIQNFAFVDCSSLKSVVIGDSVKKIGWCAFYNSASLESVKLGDSLVELGPAVFSSCPSLSYVDFGNALQKINGSAFYRCVSLTDIVLPDSVTSIGSSAFGYCDSLTSVVIPNSVTSIGEHAFFNCDRLTDVYYKGTAEEWGAISIYSRNESLENATRYYYSEEEPTEAGNWWHYVDDVPTIWAS